MSTFDNQLYWLKDISPESIRNYFSKEFPDKNIVLIKKNLNDYNNPIYTIGFTDKIDVWSKTPNEVIFFNAYGQVEPTKTGAVIYSTNLGKAQQTWISFLNQQNKDKTLNGKTYIDSFKAYYTTALAKQTAEDKKKCDEKIADLNARKDAIDRYAKIQAKRLSDLLNAQQTENEQ